jgi:hypothetical protein
MSRRVAWILLVEDMADVMLAFVAVTQDGAASLAIFRQSAL